jgi:hypothetical protein
MRNNRISTHGRAYTDSFYTQDASPPRDSGICTAVIGSMTQAMRAQSVLAESAIRATVVKISSSHTHNGCAYGVDFPCTQSGNLRTVLERAGVKVREYLRE